MFEPRHELAKLARAQRRLLPQTSPTIRGFKSLAAYRPACLATGDYYDFFHRPDGKVAIFLGDGCGHGPTASLLMAGMRAILLTHPDLHSDPGTALTTAGRMFRIITPSDLFMTSLYLLFNGDGGVSWAAAGHDPPLRITQRAQIAPVNLEPVGLPLGLDPGEVYKTVSWELDPGERLLLFTDGLVEATCPRGEPFGRRRLRSCLVELAHLPLEPMVRELVAQVRAHLEGTEFEDDFTIIAAERESENGPGDSGNSSPVHYLGLQEEGT